MHTTSVEYIMYFHVNARLQPPNPHNYPRVFTTRSYK